MSPAENIVEALRAAGCNPKRSGGGWTSRCPAHDDRNPSLKVDAAADGVCLLKCHAGCNAADVAAALGLTLADLFNPAEAPGWRGARARGAATQAAAPLETGDAGEKRPEAYRQGGGGGRWASGFRPLEQAMTPDRWAALAGAFGLPVEACRRLRVGWADAAALASLKSFTAGERAAGAWAFPEVNGAGEVVGLSLRSPTAGKRAATGGKRGLTLAEDPPGAAGPVLLVEGASDVAAAAALGCRAIGRPTCKGGVAELAELLGPDAEVLVVGERDAKPDGAAPGRDGARDTAEGLAAAWGRPVAWALVPEGSKDLRAWCTGSGAAGRAGEAWRSRGVGLVAALQAAAATVKPPAPMGPVLFNFGDVEAEAVRWLWHDRIPLGCLTLLAGPAGLGKSYATAELAAHVTTGRAWPDGTPCPSGSVLMLCAEDDPAYTTKPRLVAQGADARRVCGIEAVRVRGKDGKPEERTVTLADLPNLKAALDAMPDCKLIVVDPIGSYLGGEVDAHRDNETRAVLAPLAALAKERGLAVLIVAHVRKASVTAADDAVMGSRAFTALSRSVLHLGRDPDEPTEAKEYRRLLLPGKNNLGPRAAGLAFNIVKSAANFGGSVLRWSDDAPTIDSEELYRRAGGGKGAGEPTKLDAAREWLLDTLADGPLLQAEVKAQAEDDGHKWGTVQRAKTAAGVESKKAGDTWWWADPKVRKAPDAGGVRSLDREGGNPPGGPGKADSAGAEPPVGEEGTQGGSLRTLEPSGGGERPDPSLDAVTAWLRERLAAGPVLQSIIRGETWGQGRDWATVERARHRAGVVVRDPDGEPTWADPKAPGGEEPPPAPGIGEGVEL